MYFINMYLGVWIVKWIWLKFLVFYYDDKILYMIYCGDSVEFFFGFGGW